MIAEILAEAIQKEWSRDSKPSPHFRISSMGSCHRKQIAVRAGIPPSFPSNKEAVIKMWMGTMYGKTIQSILESSGFLERGWTEREVRYRSYVGHVDGLTRKLPDDAKYGAAIVEFKTCADDAIKRYD